MSITFVNRTSGVAIGGRIAESRRQPCWQNFAAQYEITFAG